LGIGRTKDNVDLSLFRLTAHFLKVIGHAHFVSLIIENGFVFKISIDTTRLQLFDIGFSGTVIVLADIFAAREQNTFGVSSKDILERLTAKGKDAHYFPSFEEIEKFLLKNCINGDLLITMGAGNVVEIGESLLGK
jgi:hypothetical protein